MKEKEKELLADILYDMSIVFAVISFIQGILVKVLL